MIRSRLAVLIATVLIVLSLLEQACLRAGYPSPGIFWAEVIYLESHGGSVCLQISLNTVTLAKSLAFAPAAQDQPIIDHGAGSFLHAGALAFPIPRAYPADEDRSRRHYAISLRTADHGSGSGCPQEQIRRF